MALPLVPILIGGAVVAAWDVASGYFSAREAEANAEKTKNLAELEAAHAANPSRRIQSVAILAAAVGASFIGYKFVSRK